MSETFREIIEGTAGGVFVTRHFDGTITLAATILAEEMPTLDRIDRAIVDSEVKQPADCLQSMEILMRRAHEQGLLK